MFPFFEASLPLVIAMSTLYALLAATSLSVRLASRGAAPGMLRHQVDAWWRIFPIVTLALVTFPLGVTALAALVCVLAFAELAPYRRRPGAAPLVWTLFLVTTASMAVLTRYPALPFGAQTNLGWLFYLFVLTALNDIAQFVTGKLFGRHRIAPAISPNKTWQGFAGGVVVSQIVSLAIGSYLALAAPATLMLFALPLAAGGFAGDLLFSAAKRTLSIKDFSQLIPGHGGILDRVDSLVVTAPLLYVLLHTAMRIA